MKLPKGFLLSGINCGIKNKKNDLGLICCDNFAAAVGFFTINKNKSYSVTVSTNKINNPIKAILVNSGNANCFSHVEGVRDTENLCAQLARALGVSSQNILIASTGIIGKKMPYQKIIDGLPTLLAGRGRDIAGFNESILTTDTFKKISYARLAACNGPATILGFTKGAGMIAPTIATMLAFVLTDIDIPKKRLHAMARAAVQTSFNAITVDGCMSTNDTLFVLSSRKVKASGNRDYALFSEALKKVCLDLATMIVRDGEGATKFIEIEINGARTASEARRAGLALANSNLLKCALYGANPNWGRIIAALGAGGIPVHEDIGIALSPLQKKDIQITVDLKRGNKNAKVYTSDLTPEYVKINAEYS
ncbi:MAG: bifunctional glutamate N-acetyltransferase/amino-acid acetyltransferase ArgJ [Candidatus Omnitrophota bacterium]|nr:bifunctional glutamate N-acetyltransferase/amino-acid acetyltransferase ArgJ [Candidatus Omnitrophota bacterium]